MKNKNGPIGNRLFDAVMTAHILFHKMVFKNLGGTGLTAGQPKILEFLMYSGPVVQKQLADACEIEPSTTVRLLSKMESAGLVQRSHMDSNRRSIIVTLTDHGKKQAGLVMQTFEKCETIAFAKIENRQQESFIDTFQHIEANLRGKSQQISREIGKKRVGLHFSLLACQALLQKSLFSQLSDTGLTPGQPKILEFLTENQGCLQKEIAAAKNIEPATVTSLLLYMENAGLIERRAENGNRRSWHVYLTDKGMDLAEKTITAIQNTMELAFEGIEEKQQDFYKVLLRIHENIMQEELCQK